mgnify:CR=1 FL=1
MNGGNEKRDFRQKVPGFLLGTFCFLLPFAVRAGMDLATDLFAEGAKAG